MAVNNKNKESAAPESADAGNLITRLKTLPRPWLIAPIIVLLLIGGVAGYQSYKHHQRQNQFTANHTNGPIPSNGPAPTIGHSSHQIVQASNLPACKGTELFKVPIADPGSYDYIDPLGHVSSYNGNTQHVFPVDHMYFSLRHTVPGNLNAPSVAVPIVAPADVQVWQVLDTSFEKDGQVSGHDYAVGLAPCADVEIILGHVNVLNPAIQDAITHPNFKNCGDPYATSGAGSPTYRTCTYSLALMLKSGDSVGSAGGPGVTTSAFDYGVYDERIQPLPFVAAKYFTAQNLHAVCGLQYYADGPAKTSLLRTVKNTQKAANGLPDCGTNMWDKPGSARGTWVLPDTPTNGSVPDAQGLSVIPLNNDPSQGVIDWGGTIAPADQIHFPIAASGLINRDTADVKADGQVYCFQDTAGGIAYARSVELQLVDEHTLKAAYLKGTCPSRAVLSNPTTYVR